MMTPDAEKRGRILSLLREKNTPKNMFSERQRQNQTETAGDSHSQPESARDSPRQPETARDSDSQR